MNDKTAVKAGLRLSEKQRAALAKEARAVGIGALSRELGVSREGIKSVLIGAARAGTEMIVCLALQQRGGKAMPG